MFAQMLWGWRDFKGTGRGKGRGGGVLALGAANFVDTAIPVGDGAVIAFKDVTKGVGAVGAEPCLGEEVALQGVGLDEVLEATVDAVDVGELAGGSAVELGVGAGGGDAGAGVGGGDFVGELEFETEEVDAAGSEFHGVEGVGFAEGGGWSGICISEIVGSGESGGWIDW